MAGTIFLHIGSDKAGSSSLQYFLGKNPAHLAREGIFLPRTGFRLRAGHPFLLQDLDHPSWDTLLEEIKNRPAHLEKIMLSWEGVHFYPAPQIEALRRKLEGYRVRPVLYIREQAALIQSGLLQQVKQDAPGAPNPFHLPPNAPQLFCAARNWLETVNRFDTAFGAGATLVRVLEPRDLAGGDIRTDFLHLMGADHTGKFNHVPDVNPSLSVEGALGALMMDAATPCPNNRLATRDIFERLSDELGGGKYFLSEQTVAQIREHFAQSNTKLAQERFDRERLFAPRPAHAAAPYDAALLARHLAGYFPISAYRPSDPELKAPPISIFQGQPDWEITKDGALPKTKWAHLSFRLEFRRRLPDQMHMGLELEPTEETCEARLRILDASNTWREYGPYEFPRETALIPLENLPQSHCVDMQIKLTRGALRGVLADYSINAQKKMRRP